MLKKINYHLIYTILSALVIICVTVLAIQYAKGNFRLNQEGLLPESGLLSANSYPTAAQIFIDDRLVSATDDTLYLAPGEYQVKIVKEGYSTWIKQLKVEKELVTQTNAQLFPTVPSFIPVTFTGLENVSPSPDGQKIVYYTSTASAEAKNGLYLLELINNNFIPLQKGPKQITEDDPSIDLSQAYYIWSPDSSELMILGKEKEVIIDINKKNIISELPDISFRKQQILSSWEEEMYLRERQYLIEFPEKIIQIATESAKNVYISPDKKRLLYTATAEVTIPDNLVPPIPATNTQQQNRQLIPGSIYIYDREEDKNFMIGQETGENTNQVKHLLATDLSQKQPLTLEASPSAFTKLQASDSATLAQNFNIYHSSLYINTLQWYSDSKHIIFTQEDKIQIMEYDGTNNTTIYSGPFYDNFIYPWPDGSRILILTHFSPEVPNNLYAIELK